MTESAALYTEVANGARPNGYPSDGIDVPFAEFSESQLLVLLEPASLVQMLTGARHFPNASIDVG